MITSCFWTVHLFSCTLFSVYNSRTSAVNKRKGEKSSVWRSEEYGGSNRWVNKRSLSVCFFTRGRFIRFSYKTFFSWIFSCFVFVIVCTTSEVHACVWRMLFVLQCLLTFSPFLQPFFFSFLLVLFQNLHVYTKFKLVWHKDTISNTICRFNSIHTRNDLLNKFATIFIHSFNHSSSMCRILSWPWRSWLSTTSYR